MLDEYGKPALNVALIERAANSGVAFGRHGVGSLQDCRADSGRAARSTLMISILWNVWIVGIATLQPSMT